MEFKENKAITIIKKYGLNLNTLKVWKSRGKIPDKYSDPNYKPDEVCTKKEQRQMIDLLNLEWIVPAHFQLPNYITEIISGDYKPKKKLYIQTMKEALEIKRKFQKYVNHSKFNLLVNILKDQRVSNFNLFNDAGADVVAMIERARKGFDTHTVEEHQQIAQHLKLKMSLL